MARTRQNLQSAVAAARPTTADDKTQNTSTSEATYIAPSRRGRKALTVYLDPDAVRQLKYLALDEDTTTQALVSEALNALFQERGKGRIG